MSTKPKPSTLHDAPLLVRFRKQDLDRIKTVAEKLGKSAAAVVREAALGVIG